MPPSPTHCAGLQPAAAQSCTQISWCGRLAAVNWGLGPPSRRLGRRAYLLGGPLPHMGCTPVATPHLRFVHDRREGLCKRLHGPASGSPPQTSSYRRGSTPKSRSSRCKTCERGGGRQEAASHSVRLPPQPPPSAPMGGGPGAPRTSARPDPVARAGWEALGDVGLQGPLPVLGGWLSLVVHMMPRRPSPWPRQLPGGSNWMSAMHGAREGRRLTAPARARNKGAVGRGRRRCAHPLCR